MRFKNGVMALLLAALTGCGGDTTSLALITVGPGITLVFWSGNANGDQVVDANNDAFAFTAGNGCLFNLQTGHENTLFCLTAAGDTVLYGGLRMRIVNVRSVAGTCVAALVDEATGHFVDIELDAFGREVVFVTNLHADFCPF